MESVKQIVQSNVSNQKLHAEMVEKVLLGGDLSKLTPAERLNYVISVCNSVKLNPMTKPFDYLNLNGKLVLYANKGCAEQLRQIHGVSLTIKAREAVEGCFIVTAMATLPGGRTDESVGAVSLEGLKGEHRSNAMMKAETKAKRRVTLSICGLSFLDESEIESIPGANRAAVETGESHFAELRQKPWRTFREMLEYFAAKKGELGEKTYYAVLAKFDVEHANQFRDPERALAAYRALEEALENFTREQANEISMNTPAPSAGAPTSKP